MGNARLWKNSFVLGKSSLNIKRKCKQAANCTSSKMYPFQLEALWCKIYQYLLLKHKKNFQPFLIYDVNKSFNRIKNFNLISMIISFELGWFYITLVTYVTWVFFITTAAQSPFSMKRILYDFSWIKFNLAVSCAVQVNVNRMHKYVSTKLQFANSKNLKSLACNSMFSTLFLRKMFKCLKQLGSWEKLVIIRTMKQRI